MEVECIGNTQIIHMEETGMTQRTIGLINDILSYCVLVDARIRASNKDLSVLLSYHFQNENFD